jgi:Flp pilus assembly protein TadB
MLTKIVTAALGLIVALMLLRFLSGRAHRAELRLRAEARRRREEADAEAARQAEERRDDKPDMVTLEVDPDGIYRPKG